MKKKNNNLCKIVQEKLQAGNHVRCARQKYAIHFDFALFYGTCEEFVN